MPADPARDTAASWRSERSCPICWNAFAPAGPRHRYCSDRYRSFDPNTGTFVGYDGVRRFCEAN